MSLRADQVEIQRPCPVDLPEDFRGGARNRHCGHCDKTVHLLSSLSEPEAKAFLADNAGRDVCVTYLVDHTGQIVFRPEPAVVPIAALRRPRLAAAAAVGLGLALAACAPHDNPRVEPAAVVAASEPCEGAPSPGPVVSTEVEHQVFAGGIGVQMEPPPVAEPPTVAEPPVVEPPVVAEPPRVTEPRPKVAPRKMLAGGLRAPEPPPRAVRGGRG